MTRKTGERSIYVELQKPGNLRKFTEWLTERGAEVLAPTNPWEVLRYRAMGATQIIYTNAAGRLTVQAETHQAWKAYLNCEPWRGANPGSRARTGRPVIVQALMERDGTDCFFCGRSIPEGEETVEELFAVTFGGSRHVANCCLAHNECNRAAGHLSVVEKVALRARMRAEAALDDRDMGIPRVQPAEAEAVPA